MKNLILALLFSASVTANDSIVFTKYQDKMTDRVYYMTNRDLIIANSTKTEGAKFQYVYDSNELIVTLVGLGGCNENNTIIILFENGLKQTLESWNKFDCENSYFKIEDDELLRKYEMQTIRVTNGYSFESVTVDIPKRNKRYFIQLYKSLDNIK